MTKTDKLLIFKLILFVIMGCNGTKRYPDYLKNSRPLQSEIQQEIQHKKIKPLVSIYAQEELTTNVEIIEHIESTNDSLFSSSFKSVEIEHKEGHSEREAKPEKQNENSNRYAVKKNMSKKDNAQEEDKRVFHPNAKNALILSFLGFTVILGIVAIAQASKALKEIEQNPEKYKGKAMAKLAIIISLIFIAMTMISVTVMLNDIGGLVGSFF